MAQGSKRTSRVFILLALILILILLVVVYFKRDQLLPGLVGTPKSTVTLPTPTPMTDMVDVVITTQSISRGTEFTESVLGTVKYPKKDFVEGTLYSKIKDVVGKKAKIDLDAHIPVTSSLVVDTEGGSFTAFQIPKGLVAISIPMYNRMSAVSFALQPGDHVNIIATLLFVDLDQDFQSILPNVTAEVTAPKPGDAENNIAPGLTAQITGGGLTSIQGRAVLDPTLNQPLYVQQKEEQRPRMVSQTLLQDVIVLGVGNFETKQQAVVQDQAPTPTPTPGGTTTVEEPKEPDIITVMVTPQDAITLNYLVYSGAQLTLVLRGAGDDQRVQTDAVTLQYLMEKYYIPVPAKQSYGLTPRIDSLIIPQQASSQYNIP
jgi:Flp pilus assembly protein CpaB